MYGIELYAVLYLDILVFAICVFIYKSLMADISKRYARQEAWRIRIEALHELVTVILPFIILKKCNRVKRKLSRKLKIKRNVGNSEV